MEWITNIYDPEIKRIIALSDIHGDIHALIIALRDCARVIKKKEKSIKLPETEKSLKLDLGTNELLKLDDETESLLELDLNVHNDKYRDDLDYEWCGGNTHVVICGDILDGLRPHNPQAKRNGSSTSRCGNECIEHEYDQIEIKIYRFINALNKKSGYKIHKILGNHELMNLREISSANYSAYITEKTKDLGDFYYNGISRIDYFKWNQEGGRLIFEDGVGIFLKINNNLFVHGRIEHTKTLQNYIEINNDLNNLDSLSKIIELFKQPLVLQKNKKGYEMINKIGNDIMYNLNNTFSDTLFDRYYDTYNTQSDSINQYEKCKEIKDNLYKFLIEQEPYTVNDLRIIIGHCVQSSPYYFDYTNSTFTEIAKDRNREIVSGLVYTGKNNSSDKDNNKIFGISMECDKVTLDDPIKNQSDNSNMQYGFDDEFFTLDNDERFIYKVDIGTSRAFDSSYFPNTRNLEKKYFGSRVPQVLEIGDKVRILRSTIKNTRIHQPRYKYEAFTSHIPELNKDMYKKYISYKNKYLKLKKILNIKDYESISL
jgi:hypothetical protein